MRWRQQYSYILFAINTDIINISHGLTTAGNWVTHSHSLTLPQCNVGEDCKSKARKVVVWDKEKV